MTDTVGIPVRVWKGDRWGALSFKDSGAHDVCGETVKLIDENFSIFGQHRVRLYRFKKNVHWRVPAGVELDIAGVSPAQPPRRQGRNR